jgi:hypothetical protein
MRRPHLSTGAWIAGGLLGAALLVPGISYAAATMTKIVGTNGTTVAQVTRANQLQATETAPANFYSQTADSYNETLGSCDTLTTTPANKGLIIQDVRATTYQGVSKDTLYFFAGANCTGPSLAVLNAGDADSNIDQQITPGFAIPAATSISYLVYDGDGNMQIGFTLDGYYVPKADAPVIAVIHAHEHAVAPPR